MLALADLSQLKLDLRPAAPEGPPDKKKESTESTSWMSCDEKQK